MQTQSDRRCQANDEQNAAVAQRDVVGGPGLPPGFLERRAGLHEVAVVAGELALEQRGLRTMGRGGLGNGTLQELFGEPERVGPAALPRGQLNRAGIRRSPRPARERGS